MVLSNLPTNKIPLFMQMWHHLVMFIFHSLCWLRNSLTHLHKWHYLIGWEDHSNSPPGGSNNFSLFTHKCRECHLYYYLRGFSCLDWIFFFFWFQNTSTPLGLSRDKIKGQFGKHICLICTKTLPTKYEHFSTSSLLQSNYTFFFK